MSTVSKAGVVISAAVGVAFLTLTGCASQHSATTTPAVVPNSCKAVSSCKGMANCKSMSHKAMMHKHHHKAKAKAKKAQTQSHTGTDTSSSTSDSTSSN